MLRFNLNFLCKYIVVVFFSFLVFKTKGQTCCSGGNPLIGNLGIQGIEPNSWYFQLGYDYNFLNDLYSGTKLLNDNSRERITQTILLQAIYPFSGKFSLNGLFTFVDQKRTIFSPTGAINITNANGFGDIVLLAQYNIFSELKRNLTIAAGPKLPIGKFNAVDSEYGLVLSPDLQPGSGSFDGIIGAAFNEFHFLNLTGLTLSSSSGYRITTPAKRFEGDNKYRFGNEIMFSVGLLKNFLLKRTGVTPFTILRYRKTSPDKIDKTNVAGTGGNWLYINPGFNIEPNNNWAINVAGELPVYRNLQGTQLTTSFRFNIGISMKLFRN